MKTNLKSFLYGSFVTALLILTIAAAGRQIIGISSPTTANAVATWADTTGWKIQNSGVTVTSPSSIVYGKGTPNMVNLGTISGAGTATIATTNSQYYATFSGATATIALPGSPPDGVYVIHGTDTYTSGNQIITVPSLVRPEYNSETAVTTFTNSAPTSSRKFTVAFTAVNGSFVKFSVVGDAYQ